MFDSNKFQKVREHYSDGGVIFVFYDRFSKKFGPLNVSSSIDEAVFSSCNYLRTVEEKNISLEHIDVYIGGFADVESFAYEIHEPTLFFNASDYKEAYSTVLVEVQNV